MANDSRLHEFAARGQSIWFDTLSRDLVQLGRAEADDEGRRGHRRHVEPDDLPEGALGRRRLRRADDGAARRDRRPRRRSSSRSRSRTSATRATCCRPAYDAADGADGFVSMEVAAGARVRHREDVRPGALDREGGRPAEPDREDPRDDAGPARDRGLHRARHVDQHHADLLARPLQGGRRGVPARARAAGCRRRRPSTGHSVASFFVSRVDTEADKRLEALGNTALQGKLAIANAKLAYEHFLEAFSGPRWEYLEGQGRDEAALPLGVDLDQEPGLPRRDLRRGADRAGHREHDAARDGRGVPGSRRGARRHRARRASTRRTR